MEFLFTPNRNFLICQVGDGEEPGWPREPLVRMASRQTLWFLVPIVDGVGALLRMC